jgi:hypothetical protein
MKGLVFLMGHKLITAVPYTIVDQLTFPCNSLFDYLYIYCLKRSSECAELKNLYEIKCNYLV